MQMTKLSSDIQLNKLKLLINTSLALWKCFCILLRRPEQYLVTPVITTMMWLAT